MQTWEINGVIMTESPDLSGSIEFNGHKYAGTWIGDFLFLGTKYVCNRLGLIGMQSNMRT